MNFEVIFSKEKQYWIAEVPELDLMTQGKTKKESKIMLKDAVELLVDEPGFEVEIQIGRGSDYLTSTDQESLLAFFLRRQRQKSGLTLMQLARRLGSKSPNTFARYEQGKARPTVSKLLELLKAINPESFPVIKII